jgi:hypothetical protein
LDVPCKDGGSGDDVETHVDELGCGLCSFCRFCLVGIAVDGSDYVHDGPGVVVGICSALAFAVAKVWKVMAP